MDRNSLFEWVGLQYTTEPDYPWHDENAVLRHKSNRKWFGVVMRVAKSKLGIDEDGQVDVLNIKCDPILVGSLQSQNGFHPAYHMNKDKWISIRLDGSVDEEELKNLIAFSYEMTGIKKRKSKSS